jgi:hypothetical protein
MKKPLSPLVAIGIIGIAIILGAIAIWKGTQKTVQLPDKPPSGPIVLPPSQQRRLLPHGPVSGAMTPPQPAK